jgi:hypothetical protein
MPSSIGARVRGVREIASSLYSMMFHAQMGERRPDEVALGFAEPEADEAKTRTLFEPEAKRGADGDCV